MTIDGAAPAANAPEPGAVATSAAAETELVTRARAGEAAAREELARRLRRPAYLCALQLVGDPEAALDVAQDALLRFFSTLGRLEPGRPVRPWLVRIVRNRAIDLGRRRRVRRAESLEARAADGAAEPVATGGDPHRAAERAELQRRVWRELGELPAPLAEILVLRDYQDLSYAEIAEVLEIPRGTVMSRLHRARRALAARLAADFGPREEGR